MSCKNCQKITDKSIREAQFLIGIDENGCEVKTYVNKPPQILILSGGIPVNASEYTDYPAKFNTVVQTKGTKIVNNSSTGVITLNQEGVITYSFSWGQSPVISTLPASPSYAEDPLAQPDMQGTGAGVVLNTTSINSAHFAIPVIRPAPNGQSYYNDSAIGGGFISGSVYVNVGDTLKFLMSHVSVNQKTLTPIYLSIAYV